MAEYPGGITVFCDGASRGNPGPAAFGVVAFRGDAGVSLNAFRADESQAVFAAAHVLGTRTNNEAEYEGMIFALGKCAELNIIHPTICSDSELVIRQLKGEYKVKHEKLKVLYSEALALVRSTKANLVHVRREKNQIADFLANRALDGAQA